MKEKFEERVRHQAHLHAFLHPRRRGGLRAFPTVNASVDGTNVVLHKECNIGVAVALDWGLIVPVIKNAEEKNFLGLARAINDLAERARTKKLKPEEVAGEHFLDHQSRRIWRAVGLAGDQPAQRRHSGLGAIEKRPVVIDDAIAIRSMVYLTLSYDHRVVDGAIAHQFMGNQAHARELDRKHSVVQLRAESLELRARGGDPTLRWIVFLLSTLNSEPFAKAFPPS